MGKRTAMVLERAPRRRRKRSAVPAEDAAPWWALPALIATGVALVLVLCYPVIAALIPVANVPEEELVGVYVRKSHPEQILRILPNGRAMFFIHQERPRAARAVRAGRAGPAFGPAELMLPLHYTIKGRNLTLEMIEMPWFGKMLVRQVLPASEFKVRTGALFATESGAFEKQKDGFMPEPEVAEFDPALDDPDVRKAVDGLPGRHRKIHEDLPDDFD